jgi:hypothetical protein
MVYDSSNACLYITFADYFSNVYLHAVSVSTYSVLAKFELDNGNGGQAPKN